jgi:hypothetical protein
MKTLLLTMAIIFNAQVLASVSGGIDIASLSPIEEIPKKINKKVFSNPYKVIVIKKTGVSFLYENTEGEYSIVFVKDENLNNKQLKAIDDYLLNN